MSSWFWSGTTGSLERLIAALVALGQIVIFGLIGGAEGALYTALWVVWPLAIISFPGVFSNDSGAAIIPNPLLRGGAPSGCLKVVAWFALFGPAARALFAGVY